MTAEWMERAGDVRDIQNIIEAEYHIVTEEPPELTEKAGEATGEKVGTAAPAKTKVGPIDPTWLEETLKGIKWSEDTAKTWLVSEYKVSPEGTLEDVIARLNRQQAEEFVKQLQEKATQNQASLL